MNTQYNPLNDPDRYEPETAFCWITVAFCAAALVGACWIVQRVCAS